MAWGLPTNNFLLSYLCSCNGPIPMMASPHRVLIWGFVSAFPNAMWASQEQRPSLLRLWVSWAHPGPRVYWVLRCIFTHPIVDSLRLLLLSHSEFLPFLWGADSAEILARKQSDVLVRAAHLLAHSCECDMPITQPKCPGFVHRHRCVFWVMLGQLLPEWVQGWRRPSSCLQSLLEISAAVSSLLTIAFSGDSLSLAQSHSPFEMRLLRQKPLREESLSFVSLYLIQSEIMISQLQPRPTRQGSDLSQARGMEA